MAKNKQTSGRFPHFKLFLFLALVVSLGLTTLAANTKTNIQQHAATNCASLGGTCSYGSCPTGQTVIANSAGTCSSDYMVCCKNPMPAPTGLSVSYTYCQEKQPASMDYAYYNAIVTFKWKAVSNATAYLVTLSDSTPTYTGSTYHYATKTQGVTTLTISNNWSFEPGDKPYWQVQGYNTYTKYGPLSAKQYINFKCNIWPLPTIPPT